MKTVEFTITADQCSALAAVYPKWAEASPVFADGILSVSGEHAMPIGELLADRDDLDVRHLEATKTALKRVATFHQQRADEAKAILDDPNPAPEKYPLLLAEIGQFPGGVV
ncbi:hypothetical protein B5K11_09795 [Rhizobium leguminosarum bv. trifolii]|uniref:hypothetical protein n=1 Tax=Rhizobium leguminosarum TaxID=384 RepID=UPI000E2F9EF4|nr:hypothetical protein [Rhizobium leguminosarum]RFB95232.1 hypothetical protein B5K11_09795 [Rhizobium leguminosarum bv. trifolii]